MADFPLRDICLTPVRVDQMNGMVFVNLDADARSLAETYPGLAAEIDARVPWLDTLVLTRGMHDDTPVPAEGDLAANWKVLAENCLECYHCAPAHPAFVDLVAIGTYRIANNGSWISSLSDAGQPDNQAYPFNRDDPSQHADFWFLWPNTTLNVLPGDARFVVFRFEPASATTTRTMADILTMPGAAPNPKRDNYGRNVLWPEDEGICVAVQRGLASRGYDRGRFVVDRDMTEISEHGVHHFQRLWAQTMGFVP
jgi:choline monooxygenase